jgi:lactoylglutathione lyase
MTSPLLGLRTVIYKVSNLASAKTWYATVFATDPYFDEPFYVGFNIGGYELGLQPVDASPEPKAESVVAYWGVADVEEAYARMIGLGAKENEPPQNVGDDIVVATLKDPWDNVLGLIYNPHFRINES